MSLLFDNFDFLGVQENLNDVDIPVEEYMNSVGLEDNPYIMCEFAERMYKAEAAFYMVDAVLEHKVLAGEDVSVLVENAITDRIQKAIQWIKEFVGKIIAWFKKQIEQIAMLVSSGATLNSKYGTKLKEKAKKVAKDFEYDIPKYNFNNLLSMQNAREFKDVLQENREKISTLRTTVDYIKKDDSDSKIAKIKEKRYEEIDTVAVRERIINGCKDDAIRIGKPGDIATYIADYLKYVGYYKEALASIKKAQKEFEKNSKTVIKEIEKIEKGIKDDTNARLVNDAITISRDILTMENTAYNAYINVSKEAYKDVFGVLRKLIVFKEPKRGAKESFISDESLFEAAFNSIGRL